MTHHTAAYFETTGAAVTDSQINALTDGVLSIRNNNFFLDQPLDLIFAAVMGLDLSRARIDSPTLRNITRPYLFEIGAGVDPDAVPRFADYWQRPFRLPADQELELQVTEASVGGSNITALINLLTNNIPAPGGDIYTLRATSTTAATANAWSNIGPLTFDNSLPPGRYAVVGGIHQSANGQGFRVDFQSAAGQKEKPGGMSVNALDDKIVPRQRLGGWGVWGEFDNTVLPSIEVLANGADAAHEVYLDIIKVR